MIRLTTSACIDAPAEAVWAHLSRLDQIHLWTDAIHRSHLGSKVTCGVGAERVCELRGNRTLHEHFVAWEEGRSFTYVSTDAPGMKLARNTWTVAPAGTRAIVTSVAEVELRGGWIGRLLGFLLAPVLRLVLPNPLAKLKFWVENGRPYEGSARSLPIPAPGC